MLCEVTWCSPLQHTFVVTFQKVVSPPSLFLVLLCSEVKDLNIIFYLKGGIIPYHLNYNEKVLNEIRSKIEFTVIIYRIILYPRIICIKKIPVKLLNTKNLPYGRRSTS